MTYIAGFGNVLEEKISTLNTQGPYGPIHTAYHGLGLMLVFNISEHNER